VASPTPAATTTVRYRLRPEQLAQERENKIKNFVVDPKRVRYAETVPAQAKALAKQIGDKSRRDEREKDQRDLEAAIRRLTDRAAKLTAGVIASTRAERDNLLRQQRKEGLTDLAVSSRLGKVVREVPVFQTLARELIPEGLDEKKQHGRQEAIKLAIVKESLGQNNAVAEYLAKQIPGWAKQQMLDEARRPLRESIPGFLQFLSDTLYVDVDAQWNVRRIAEKFGNDEETFEKKILRQHNLLYRYPKIMQQLWEDAEGRDDNYAIPATILLLIERTGIRPGSAGAGIKIFAKDEAGKRVRDDAGAFVEDGIEATYGAITLLSSDVLFEGNTTKLDFRGKAGTQNMAVVDDARLTKLLRKFKERGKERLFTYTDGSAATVGAVKWYCTQANPVFDGVNITDFRKLHAAREFHADLLDLLPGLYAELRAMRSSRPADVERVVVIALTRAIQRAQKALNHKNMAVTIEAYINPEILIHFLSRGTVDETLETTILGKTPLLEFDAAAFLQEAKG